MYDYSLEIDILKSFALKHLLSRLIKLWLSTHSAQMKDVVTCNPSIFFLFSYFGLGVLISVFCGLGC